jgi:hypothetical protein
MAGGPHSIISATRTTKGKTHARTKQAANPAVIHGKPIKSRMLDCHLRLRLTQQNIDALQAISQQTAKLHQQFLEGTAGRNPLLHAAG